MGASKFTEDQIAMAKECADAAELIELAKEENVELSDEDLDAISGGWDKEQTKNYYCKKCGVACKWEGPQKRYVCPSCKRQGMYPCDMDSR